MPAIAKAAQRVLKERSAEATRQLRETLGRDDLDLLVIALAEVATAEAQRDTQFAERICAVYDSLVEVKFQPTPSARASRASAGGAKRAKGATEAEEVTLIPITVIKDAVLDPFAPPDPYFLNRLYGPSQLFAALARYSLPVLKKSLPLVQAQCPGTKPRRISSKDDVIAYMVAMVTDAEVTSAQTA